MGSLYASSGALPGDFMYPLKRLTEHVEFLLTFNDKNKVELRITFFEKRLNEIIRKYEEKGSVDIHIFEIMLNEAKAALHNSAKLSIGDRKNVLYDIDALLSGKSTLLKNYI